MKCDTCGFEDSKTYQACRLCGSSWQVIENNVKLLPPPPKTQKKTKSRLFYSVILVVIFVLGFGIYFSFYRQKNNYKTLQNIPLSASIMKSHSPSQLVMDILSYAMDDGGINFETQIEEVVARIKSFPAPPKSNQKLARNANEKGLVFANSGNFEKASEFFAEGYRLNSADIEISDNFGYALVKTGNFDTAEQVLIKTLSIAPKHSNAWKNLGEVYANKGEMAKAVACFSNVYRFSKNRIKTYQFMQQLNNEEHRETVRRARQTAMDWAAKVYSDLY